MRCSRSCRLPNHGHILLVALLVLATTLAATSHSRADAVTILTPDRTVELMSALVVDDELLVPTDDLSKLNGLVIKPEGVCHGDLCIPLRHDAALPIVVERAGQSYVNIPRLAKHLSQPLLAEPQAKVWSLGEIPAVRSAALAGGQAPDFTLANRQGQPVRLSDFRGKKVLLVTWASWCGCSLDLVGWQTVYEQLKDKNFELVAVAEDTAGEAAAGKFYDRAKATYTCLLDPDHVVSSLYHLVNVPMGIWIDEQGKIVRAPEVAYSRDVALLSIHVPGAKYVDALRDWVEKGDQSAYVMRPADVQAGLATSAPNAALADAHFKLAAHFQEKGKPELAAPHWKQAQALHPDSWNYHRQEWSFESNTALKKWMQKFRELKGKPYYTPLELGNQ